MKESRNCVLEVSVIIPTLNEEGTLPGLLNSLFAQSRKPDEIIIVDAGSIDSTILIANDFGIKTSKSGGHPSKSRNIGANLASGLFLLFLDADVLLDKDSIEKMLRIKNSKQLNALSFWTTPVEKSFLIKTGYLISNLIHKLLCIFRWPHGYGCCLLVDKDLHEKIGGFDSSIILAEDEDYISRLSKSGKYSFSNKLQIKVSSRRIKKYGLLKISLINLAIWLHRVFIGKVTTNMFNYFEFNSNHKNFLKEIKNGKTPDYLLREYDALRKQIDGILHEIIQLERLTLISSGVIWSWLATSSNVVIPKFIYFAPAVLTLLLGGRVWSLNVATLRTGEYIYSI